MRPKISVITPCSRGVKELDSLINDFRNQTFQNFEHIMVYDGTPPDDVSNFVEDIDDERFQFFCIAKDTGDMKIAPGTRPRNTGVKKSTGEYLCFADDDDRYKDTYLESLVTGAEGNLINVVQMSCQESRMYKNGDPKRINLVPEVGLPWFPIICHVGTPCFIVRREWALECPWQHEPEHDYRFIKRICEKYQPQINLITGMQVDVDGLVMGNVRDWVSKPPFFRSEKY